MGCCIDVALGPAEGTLVPDVGAVTGAVRLSQGAGSPALSGGFQVQKGRRAAGGPPCTLQHIWGRRCQAAESLHATCAITSNLLLCPPPPPPCRAREPCGRCCLSQARRCTARCRLQRVWSPRSGRMASGWAWILLPVESRPLPNVHCSPNPWHL